MTTPILNCPQSETPIRERAWTDEQRHAMFKYTADEVRTRFETWTSAQPWFKATIGFGRSGDEYADPCINSRWQGWWAAYAERIAADEGAVPVAVRYFDGKNLDGSQHYAVYSLDRHQPNHGAEPLFLHPPAQAAQVDAMRDAYRAGFCEACGWGYPVTGDMDGQAFESALKEFLAAQVPTTGASANIGRQTLASHAMQSLAPAAAPVAQVDRSDALEQAEEDAALEGDSEPVAQGEVVDIDTIALRAAEEIALMWGQDRSQFVAKIQVRIIAALQRVHAAPHFRDTNTLAEWLESLHECHAGGAVGNRKWEPAQIAAKAMREPAQPAELPEFLKDPANVHAMMLRGAIAIPSIRSMVDLRGEVPNGEDVQLARIAELQEQVAALEAQPDERVVPDWKATDVRNEADALDEEYDLTAITMLRDFADLIDLLTTAQQADR